MPDVDAQREAALVLLDAVSAFHDGPDLSATTVALRRLWDVGAVPVSTDMADIEPLLLATLWLVDTLVGAATREVRAADRDDAIISLRQAATLLFQPPTA